MNAQGLDHFALEGPSDSDFDAGIITQLMIRSRRHGKLVDLGKTVSHL
jgi:hypothetical protein